MAVMGTELLVKDTIYSATGQQIGPVNGLVTNGTVAVVAGASVGFKANAYIHLKPGFSVNPGASFKAEIVSAIEPTIGADSDGDGMPDLWELNHAFNPAWAEDSLLDADGDGISNLVEFQLGSDPRFVTAVTIDKGRSASGVVDLNSYQTNLIQSLTVVMSGGGAYPGGTGAFNFAANLGGYTASYTSTGTGSGGGAVYVAFRNITRSSSGNWSVEFVEVTVNGVTSVSASNIVLASSTLSYSAAGTLADISDTASMAVVSIACALPDQPSLAKATARTPVLYTNEAISVVLSGKDPNGNLREMDVWWRMPDGVMQSLSGWQVISQSTTGSSSLEWSFATPRVAKMGTYTVWVKVRDSAGNVRDPMANASITEMCDVNVIPAPPISALNIPPGSGESSERLKVAPILNGSINLNDYQAVWYYMIECQISGGGSMHNLGAGPGTGVLEFTARLGSVITKTSLSVVGGGGAQAKLRLWNVRLNSSKKWVAERAEFLGGTEYQEPKYNIEIGDGVLTCATTAQYPGDAVISTESTLTISYARNQAPNTTAVSGTRTEFGVGERASFIFSATDADSNLSALQVCWKTPSGNVVALSGWLPFAGGGCAGSSSMEFSLPAFTEPGTYEVWVNAEVCLGGQRLPHSAGFVDEIKSVLVVSSSALNDTDQDGCPDVWEQRYGLNMDSSVDALVDSDGDGLSNVAEYNLGTNPMVKDSGSGSLGSTLPAGWNSLVAPGARTELVGATVGQLSVDKNGAGTYTIDIPVVPGTAGIQPKFSLSYSSQAGPGLAGMGWSLGGLSSISRGPQTLRVDGAIKGVTLSATDRFYMDGQRLIAVLGEYGANGTEYRTENETFSRIISYGGATESGPMYFKVWTKAGLIIEMGNSVDSRFDGSSTGIYLSWSVNRISDTLGNYMSFSYEKDSAAGIQRIARIDYTKFIGTPEKDAYASLRFGYEARGDSSVGFLRGVKMASDKRLKTVSTWFGETDSAQVMVRSMTLEYEEYGVAKRSLLRKITETARYEKLDGTSGESVLPSLTFDYNTSSGGFAEKPAFAPRNDFVINGKSQGAGYVDLNGDGLPDYVKSVCNSSGSVTDAAAWINTGGGWLASSNYIPPMPLNKDDGTGMGCQFVDIDGDGMVDFVSSPKEKVCMMYQNTGSGWAYRPDWALPSGVTVQSPNDREPRFFIDLNADGLVDFVYRNDLVSGAYINHSNDSGRASIWEYASAWVPPAGFANKFDQHSIYTDLNGDTLPDLVTYQDTGRSFRAIALNTGSGWNVLSTDSEAFIKLIPPLVLSRYKRPDVGANELNVYACELADVNGDGLSDLVYGDSFNLNPGTVGRVYLNTGYGWVLDTTRDFSIMMGDKGPCLGVSMIDINADGLADIARREGGGSASDISFTQLGTCTGFLPSDSSLVLPLPLDKSVGTGTNPSGADLVDLNADGAIDMVQSCDGTRRAFLNTASPNIALRKVTTGLGVSAELVYKPLTDPSVYFRDAGSKYPIRDLAGGGYVVSQVKNDDGQGGTHDQHYLYGGLRSHALYGSLGFEWMSVMDSLTQIRSTTIFSQLFPTIGMPIGSFTTAQDGSILSSSDIKYGVKGFNGGLTRMPYVVASVEESYDLNGDLVNWSRTTTGSPDQAFDDYGNALLLKVENGDGDIKLTTSKYENWIDNTGCASPWILGRLSSSLVATTTAGVIGQDRQSSFGYDKVTGLLARETIEPGAGIASPLYLNTEYEHDSYGNRKTITVKGFGLPESGRITMASYTPTTGIAGRFKAWTKVWKKDNVWHEETYEYYNHTGAVRKLTGPNNLDSQWEYDALGRKTYELRADSTSSRSTIRWAGIGSPAGATYSIENQASGTAPSVVFYDRFGRPIESYGVNGGGLNGATRIVGLKTWYDRLGRAWRTSLPYFFGSTPIDGVRTESYDLLGRPLIVSTPHETLGRVSVSYSYAGLVTSASGPNAVCTQTTRTMSGKVSKLINNSGALAGSCERGEIIYEYNADGNLWRTKVLKPDGGFLITEFGFDRRGRKISMSDPSMGTWSYRYNALGELVEQEDYAGNLVTMVYDPLGRLESKTEKEGRTEWFYDTASGSKSASGCWFGLLHRVKTTPSRRAVAMGADHSKIYEQAAAELPYEEEYGYDPYGRPNYLKRSIIVFDDSASLAGATSIGQGLYAKSFESRTTYDSSGRLFTTEYPNHYVVRNIYSETGFLKEVREGATGTTAAPGRLIWQADSYAINGSVDGSTLGNGLTYDRVISPATGRVQAITVGAGILPNVEYVYYDYSALGNVIKRKDFAGGREETFEYDALSRLKSFSLNGIIHQEMTYDCLGNLRTKTEVGTYHYDGPTPYAASHSELPCGAGLSFTYDLAGNMTGSTAYGPATQISTGLVRSMSWTSGNQLKTLTTGNLTSTFYLGASHERILQVLKQGTSVKEMTFYMGAYEDVCAPGSTGETKCYIMTPLGRTAVRIDRHLGAIDYKYFHQDALGSILAVSSEYGLIEKRYAFDPWGKREVLESKSGLKFTRGFTDHEHLDEHGLIHMNGRVYDPVLGRFLSADPFVDDAKDSQAYNRYSYVSNNPLNATDPSGYIKIGEILKTAVVVAIAVVAAVYLGPYVSHFLGQSVYGGAAWGVINPSTVAIFQGIGGGLAGGLASGFAGSLLNGGSLGEAFKAGAIGGLVGGVTGGMLGYIGAQTDLNWFNRGLAHGVVQGGSSEATGGEFRHGFYAGFAVGATEARIGTWAGASDAKGITAAAVVGGTASAIGGGKFANGAVHGAFSYMFNWLAHKNDDNVKFDILFYSNESTASELSDILIVAKTFGAEAVGVNDSQGIEQWFLENTSTPIENIAVWGHSARQTFSIGNAEEWGASHRAWSVMGGRLPSTGTIYIFGCTVGSGDRGQMLVDGISASVQRAVWSTPNYLGVRRFILKSGEVGYPTQYPTLQDARTDRNRINKFPWTKSK